MWENAFLRTIAYLACMVLFWGSAKILSGAISTAILKYKRRGGRQYTPGRVYQAFFRLR
jgi:hypothetical protein